MWQWLTGKTEQARQFARMRDVVQDEAGCRVRNRYTGSLGRTLSAAAYAQAAAMQNGAQNQSAYWNQNIGYTGSAYGRQGLIGLDCGKWACNCRNAA